jgi:ribosomal protein L37AE/L43A
MKNCPFCGEPVEHRFATEEHRERWNCIECGADQTTGDEGPAEREER